MEPFSIPFIQSKMEPRRGDGRENHGIEGKAISRDSSFAPNNPALGQGSPHILALTKREEKKKRRAANFILDLDPRSTFSSFSSSDKTASRHHGPRNVSTSSETQCRETSILDHHHLLLLDLLSREEGGNKKEDIALAQIDFGEQHFICLEDGASSHWRNMKTTAPSWNQSR